MATPTVKPAPSSANATAKSRPRNRAGLWMFNGTISLLRRMRLPIGDLSEASILSAARRRTKLDDWGSEAFREPLQILLRSLEQEAPVSPTGRLLFRSLCIQGVMNRLRMQRDFKEHAEILEVPIRRPLFVLGWPRTGTTLLHNLLALDPASRALHLWELVTPSPPPDASTRDRDPRLRTMRRSMARVRRFAPQTLTVHACNADAPEECDYLFRNAFAAKLFDVITDVPAYSEWLKRQDMLPQYADYRRQLQLLSWRSPGEHLVLKAPSHLWMLEALLKTFPDACIVQTHRDPAKSLPSACSLALLMRKFIHQRPDPMKLGGYFTDMFLEGMEVASRTRRHADPQRFFDVHYDQLVADPCETVRRIYAYFGYDFPEEMQPRMRRWLHDNPAQKHGVHRYSLEQFGLDEEFIARRFEDCMSQFPFTVA